MPGDCFTTSEKMEIVKTEALLRVSATLLLVLTAFLVGFDTQSKLIFDSFVKKATFRELNALIVLLYVDSLAAGYNLLQLIRNRAFSRCEGSSSPKVWNHYLAWVCFILDQATVYVVFATTSAALEASVLALFGQSDFQWMKICDRFTRFCVQIGGALFCSTIACLLLAGISFISAFSLFRLYSPKQFLKLKS